MGMATAASSRLQMPSAADVRDNAAWKAFKPLVTGAMAGMVATTCTQPLDTLKVRVQVAAASGKSYGGLKLWTPGFMRNLYGRSSSYGRWNVDVSGTLMPRLVQCAWGRISGQRTRCGYGISDAQLFTDVLEKCL